MDSVLAHEWGTAEAAWAVVSELLLLAWVTLLVLAPRWGGPSVRWRWFRLTGLAAAVVASALTLVGKLVEVWPGHPQFPSEHTAFGVTVAVVLVGWNRRWLPWVFALLCLLGTALVYARYHTPLEILGGAGVGLAAGLAAVGLLTR